MSVENLNKFQKDLEEKEELRKKFDEEMKSEGVTSEKDFKKIVKIAQKLGYDITEEDFVNGKSANIKDMENGELSDEELDKVAGGAFFCGPDAPDGHEIGCWWTWYDDWLDYFAKKTAKCANCGLNLGNTPGYGYDRDHVSRQCSHCKKYTSVNDNGNGVCVTDEPKYGWNRLYINS